MMTSTPMSSAAWLSAEALAAHEQTCCGSSFAANCRRNSGASTSSDLSQLLASEFSDTTSVDFGDHTWANMSGFSLVDMGYKQNWPGCSKVDGMGAAAITSVVVRNIPSRYTAEMLLEEWPIMGTYDILYLPTHAARNRCAGYAFINFTSSAAAHAFRDTWRKQHLDHFRSSKNKALSISFSVQGRDKFIQLFNESVGVNKPASL
jgi:hypothetical protein